MGTAINHAAFDVQITVTLDPPLIADNESVSKVYYKVALKSLRFNVGIDGRLKSPWGRGNYVKRNGEEALTTASNVLVRLENIPAAVQQDVRDEYRRLVTQAHENLF